MSFTLTTSGAIVQKAGLNASSGATTSGALLENYSNFAEGMIVEETRRNWVTQHSGLSTDMKNALSDVASDLAAMKVIIFDMSGYTSRSEAQTMLNVLRDNANRHIINLKDFKSNEIKDP